jgi:PAS domain-containing protein
MKENWWKLFWICIIAIVILEVILVSGFSLTRGTLELFPFLFILPILLLARTYPRFAIYVTIILGWIYILLVYFSMPYEIKSFASSIAWFYIFVTIGVVISSLAESGRQEHKFREMFDNSLAGIFTFDVNTLKLVQSNLQTAVMLGYTPAEMEGLDIASLMSDESEIQDIVRKLSSEKKLDTIELALKTGGRSGPS